MIHITKIYLVTNCYGDPNKVYIGKEKFPKKDKREYAHRKTYGIQIQLDHIDQVEGWERQNWKPLETFWIQYFKFLGFDVVNVRKEGGGGPEFCSEQTKAKISKANKGKKHSQKTKNKISRNKERGSKISKSLKGRVSVIKGLNRLNSTKNKISKANKGKPKPKGFGEEQSIRLKGKSHPTRFVSVIQYNLQNEFIKEWESISKVRNELKIIIDLCLKGKQKTAGGYIWKYK